jgi:hypothetical protein
MNAREVLSPSKFSAGRSAPLAQWPNFAANGHLETILAFVAGKFMALKPAEGAEGE